MSHTTITTSPATDLAASHETTAARLAGAAATVAIGLVVAGAAAAGGDAVEIARSPLAIASAALTVASLLAMAFTLGALQRRLPELADGIGRAGTVLGLVGCVLVAGGYWSSVFVLPGLADAAPDVTRDGLPSVTAGFVVSYAVLGLGWLLVAVRLVRAGVLGVSGWFLGGAAVLCVSPLPFRFLPLAITVAIAIGFRLRR